MLSYLKTKIPAIALLLLFAFLLIVIFYLYDLPMEAVTYLILLCDCIGALMLLGGGYRFVKRHKQLEELKPSITLSSDGMPEARQIVEQDYQELIEIVQDKRIEELSNMDAKYSDMLDYYTMWAHQIKTPIAAMRLVLQSKESAENAQLRQELFKIEQYVEMVLQYIRLDSDSTDFVIRAYELDDIIRQAVRKYSTQFIGKKIRLEYEPLEKQVLTDEKWLLFVIEQILSNALKYTKDGKIAIYLEQSKEGEMLVLEDTGIGIQPEDIERVFEKGYTGYNGRADKTSTGIGLYLCKRILEKLSHSIRITSVLGEGTKVMIGIGRSEQVIE